VLYLVCALFFLSLGVWNTIEFFICVIGIPNITWFDIEGEYNVFNA
jgi:uncharacterized membrane protein